MRRSSAFAAGHPSARPTCSSWCLPRCALRALSQCGRDEEAFEGVGSASGQPACTPTRSFRRKHAGKAQSAPVDVRRGAGNVAVFVGLGLWRNVVTFLASRATKGMNSWFADEVAAASPAVTAVVARLVGDEAEDVVQEAVLRAYLALSQLRERERFTSWLCGIALNVAKTRLRRAAIERQVLAALGQCAESREIEPLLDVRDAVELLPAGQREAVLLHYIDGLSCDEVAAVLGSTAGAVRVRLHRARAELRRQLVPEAPAVLRRKETVMVELTVEDVLVKVDAEDSEKLVSEMRVVILRERDGERRLPIWIGQGEGDALAVRLQEGETVRPLTYDLVTEMIRTLGGRVDSAAITRLEGMTFYATLSVEGRELDARPSDAINIAVRTGAPIMASTDVLENAGVGDESELDVKRLSVDASPGEWRSLSKEVLAARFRPPLDETAP